MTRPPRRPRFVDPTANRSLERGIDILRAFRPGTDLMGNSEIAERVGLPRSTVSRLAQTLVRVGFLEHDRAGQAYRLAAPVLSLGLAMRMSSPILKAAAPLMQETAESRRINVGLAAADRESMIYLESIRYNRRVSLRRVVTGQRIPIELTSLGRAYLSTLAAAEYRAFLAELGSRRPADRARLAGQIEAAFAAIRARGYCVASWQPGVTALATPIVLAGHPVYALNVSISADRPDAARVAELGSVLMDLAERLRQALRFQAGEAG